MPIRQRRQKPLKLMVEVTGVIDAPAEKTWPLLRDSLAPKEVYGMTAAYRAAGGTAANGPRSPTESALG
ncbi:hypothetical protein GCM10009555_059270 [Acrocarpospora macrocephala]|uniref:Uncharacterized protein n=1 Tax=Acrocarpospora macrocephala TaxID=150177 RepID=A0A5M3X0N9_9ACTN|nr:hypothetical protein [Acrocarpospora macrocephala]GES11848.1 hypothetical protein Amac_054450 [Acrocarpospora macrocephala]